MSVSWLVLELSLEGFSYLFMIRNEVCSFDLGDLIVALNITTKERSSDTEFLFILKSYQIFPLVFVFWS